MPQSLASVQLHTVFSTKGRNPFLLDADLRREVHAYIGGVSNKLGCQTIAVGGIEDHVHVVARMSRTLSIADWIKEVKRASSQFAAERNRPFAWQAGYGVFSVGASELDVVCAYVRGQEEHHRKETFPEEFLRLLREYEMQWDDRYVWD
jgi:putative transposase